MKHLVTWSRVWCDITVSSDIARTRLQLAALALAHVPDIA